MKRSEYIFELNAIMSRIENTSNMINSFTAKFFNYGIFPISSSNVANAAKNTISEFNVEKNVDPKFWYGLPEDASIPALDEKLRFFESLLKNLQELSIGCQLMHAFCLESGKFE